MASGNRILLVSPAHAATDPRIMYKYVPVLARQATVRCLLTGPGPETLPPACTYIRLRRFAWLGWRILLIHPVIAWHIVRFRPRTIHIFMPELLPLALCCRLFGIRVMYDIQENLRLKFHLKPRNNHWLFRNAFEVFDLMARRSCYCIFTEDSYLTEYSHLRYPPAVIHNYPALSYIHPFSTQLPDPSYRNDFAYIGLLSPERGLDTMIEALAILKPVFPSVRLHLFGRLTVSQTQLETISGYYEVAEQLIFYGPTDHIRAFPVIASCCAGLAVLKPVGDYPLSYPCKLFEYMALAIPVIASDFPLYRSIIEPANGGLCVPPANARALAESMNYLLQYRSNTILFGKQGQKAVEEQYNWESEGEKLFQLYFNLTKP
ncbi:glycosyltransferase [Arsenicibacter rosenii]|uniref:Glycosyl transferase family 1 domain-containing protein n=1 Tax=Arsenicibacter rosenii TaxID=1750698 RepID=A0A1S2VCV9_9BACT|nr:glycosyltransferase [Arsenicibacter rosenii]OIN56509.1 hypothetical protein BLX24_24650 [Arsenicibacter rosenii]